MFPSFLQRVGFLFGPLPWKRDPLALGKGWVIFSLGPVTACDLMSCDFYTIAKGKCTAFQSKTFSPGRLRYLLSEIFLLLLSCFNRNAILETLQTD